MEVSDPESPVARNYKKQTPLKSLVLNLLDTIDMDSGTETELMAIIAERHTDAINYKVLAWSPFEVRIQIRRRAKAGDVEELE